MCADWLRVVPGQVRWLWCGRCRTYSALHVGVYVTRLDGPPELVGTFTGCAKCDPDLFDGGQGGGT